MKKITHKKLNIVVLFAFATVFTISVLSCAVSQKVNNKSGAQLWTENCQRCHNIPNPSSFSADQWETIGMHMQTRALITEKERDKVVIFLQQAKQNN